jgi:Pentapeptide repeats (8 copies)
MSNDFRDLTGTEFERADMSGTRFSSVRLNGATILHSLVINGTVALNEEWHHRLYAERDLAVLEERS